MKIVHLCLASFFPDNYSYQENMLPKFHKEQGNDVEVIASLVTFDEKGKTTLLEKAISYRNEYDILVTRLDYKPGKFNRRMRRYIGLEEALEKSEPDVLFIHGCQFYDICVVVRYLKKHNNVRVYVDNHSDFCNSATNWLSLNILHKIIWRRCAHLIEPYTTKFYGVLPARVDFLNEVYGLPKAKCELLVMGADDTAVAAALNPQVRNDKRNEYGINDDEIVLITGGKIDHNKPQTLILMDAVNNMSDKRVKLLVFGSVVPELKEQFNYKLSERVKYIGWIKSDLIYNEYAAADLVVFPGLHSVLWEQAVGMGKPCVFRKISGFDHIDLGGNCMYFEVDSAEAYKNTIDQALKNINQMKEVATEKGIQLFSYKDIARRALEE